MVIIVANPDSYLLFKLTRTPY